ncbi:hypothetical protein [Winogradskyella immobilis]|uniref:Uncharacterized protein n=1 Tax=Winogradskyella immobilis TaxID=2816852 RepID=A0ABS8ELL7_9FLAO|nr:hypothetical protein [Winogradskyella immobilis]MCC1484109.1 hypothetical protein [Winogradskyella immobilis]MCG0016201.1 hypothetical protein [Winogradskyella immobilis]
MKNFTRILIVFLLTLTCCNVFSQTEYARLDKNKNPQVEGFYHNLNKTKDTLILKSDRKINYLYSIDKSQNKDLNLLVDAKTYKLPLNKLGKGKHVFVAIQSPLRIVFVVHMLEEIPIGSKKVVTVLDYAIKEEELASSKHN